MKIKLTTLFLCIIYLSFACGSSELTNSTGRVFDTIPLINDTLLIREVKSGIVTKEYREINGKKEGLFKKFDKNGKLESWGNYVSDQKNGRWQRADSLDSLHFFVTVFKDGRQIGFGYRYLYWKPPHRTRIWNITTTEGDSINRDWGYYKTGEVATYNYSNETVGHDTGLMFNKAGDTTMFVIFKEGKLVYENHY